MHSDRSEAPSAAGELTEALPLRVREMATLRGLGYSQREIGALFGISPQAVSATLTRYQRAVDELGDAVELRGLSARALNVLGRHGIRSRDEARARGVLDLIAQAPNCGRKTREELERWLGHDAGATLGRAAGLGRRGACAPRTA